MSSLIDRKPISCLITPGNLTPSNFVEEKADILETVRSAADLGIGIVQIREKALPGKLLHGFARECVAAVKGTGCRVLVNERFDIAVAAGADGVHLTSTSIPPWKVRAVTDAGFVVGVSTHSLAEILAAEDSGADFVVFGPVFDSPGKTELEGAKGLADLAGVCAKCAPFPVLALGGIDRSNFRQALAAGASGIAAIRLFRDAGDAASVIGELCSGREIREDRSINE